MRTNRSDRIAGYHGVVDYATLYLCRHGHTWVVVLESPRAGGVLCLHDAGDDSFGARFELLSTARRACPEGTILSIDGALAGADYELLLCVRGAVAHTGDIGTALHRALAAHETRHPGRRRDERRLSHRCHRGHWGPCPRVSGRPLAF